MLLFDAPEKRKATKRKNPVDKTYPISFFRYALLYILYMYARVTGVRTQKNLFF